eukprot:gene5596-6782_t
MRPNSWSFGIYAAVVWRDIQLITRRFKIYCVAFFVYATYKRAGKKAEKIKDVKAKAEFWDGVHTRMARYVFQNIVKLEGLWVKLGQFVATRTDVMPDAWIAELVALQDCLPVRSWSETRRTIEEEFKIPIEKAFETVDKEPLGTASIAQVHRAVLHSGQEVVIKVQHRNIDRIITQDLDNTVYLANYLAAKEPKYDFRDEFAGEDKESRDILTEWCKETVKELDFEHEASNMERVAANLRKDPNIHVHIPFVVRISGDGGMPPLHPTKRVLLLEFIDGVKPTDLSGLAKIGVSGRTQCEAILTNITASFAHQVFIDGLFNADPHPGNMLIQRNSHTPVLIDFGLTKEIPEKQRLAFARLLIAAADYDMTGVLGAMREMGLENVSLDHPEDAMDAVHYMFRDAQPTIDQRRTAIERRSQHAAIPNSAAPDAPSSLRASAPSL